MVRRVIIAGCGNMGSFHMLSLCGLGDSCSFEVVESYAPSVEVAKGRISDFEGSVEWFDSIDEVGCESDLAIVATLATGRVDVIERLLEKGHRRFLIEKVVCQSVAEYDRLLVLMDRYGAKGWVNCTRRYCEFYEGLASVLHEGDGPIVMNVKAGSIGLGCNAVHYLDLFGWLTGDFESLELDGRYVSAELLENRRGSDLCEFGGTITGRTERGDFVSISFLPDGDGEMSVSVAGGDVRAFANELSGRAVLAPREGGWEFGNREFRIPYTSEVTRVIAEEIFSTDSCRLPTVAESFVSHRELFSVFGSVAEGVNGRKVELCPIT